MEVNSIKNEDTIDVKFGFFIVLSAFYVIEMVTCVYSLLQFTELTVGSRTLPHPPLRKMMLIDNACR